MGNSRPWKRLSIGDLEEIFQRQSDDPETHDRLKHELSCRNTSRAKALLHRIQQMKNPSRHLADPDEKSKSLSEGSAQGLIREVTPTTKIRERSSIESSADYAVKTGSDTSEQEVLPQLSLEDACRILKVAVGDAWEKVETARRNIVAKSSPLATCDMSATQVAKLLGEAKLANDAATVIFLRRSGQV